MHQLPDQKQPATPPAGRGCLAVEGDLRAGHQRDIPRVLQPTVSIAEEYAYLQFSRLDHKIREIRPLSKSGLPVHRDAVQHSTGHSGALPKMRLKVQSVHQHWMTNPNITVHDLHRLLGMLVFLVLLVQRGTLRLPPVQWGPPQHGARGPGAGPTGSQFLSGCCQRCLVGISSSSTRSSLRHQWDGSDSLSGCVQFGLGSPVRLTLITGTVVSISKIVAHQHSGDAGRHQRWETSYLIWGSRVVLLNCDNVDVGWNYLSMPKLQRLHRWSLGMDK